MSPQPTGPISQQHYEQLVASIDGIVWEADARTFQFTFVSQQAERLLGYPLEQWLTPDFWTTRLHPEDRDWVVEFCRRATDEKRKHDLEYRMVAADGRTVWLRNIVSVVVEGDKATTLCGIMVDVTNHKQAEAALRESEELYRFLMENAQVLLVLYNLDGQRVYVSPSIYRLLGWLPDATFGGVHPEDLQTAQQVWQRVRAGEKTYITYRHAHTDGTWRWIEAWGSLVHYHGKPHVMVVSRDVTARKQAEEALRESEAKLEEAQRIAHVGYWENDLDADRITWSDETYRILGLRPREISPTLAEFRERIHPEDRQRQSEATARAQRGESRYDVEYRVVRPDGEVRTIHSLGDVLRSALGRPVRAFGTVQDITDRKRTDEALTLFRSLIDHTNDTIEIIDPETGRFLDVNQQACLTHGYTREEYLTLRVPDIDPLIAQQPWQKVKEGLLQSGTQVRQSQHRRKDGSVFPVEVNVTYIRLDRDYFLAVVRDITERKQAEQALTESHSLLHAVVEGTSDAIFVKDLQGCYLMINSAGARFLNKTVEEVVGKDDQELFAPDAARAVMEHDRQIIASGESQTFEEQLTVADVTRTYIATKGVFHDTNGNVIGLVGISRDITELKRLEEQFRQSQKMEAIGRLAGGVAHDFNNILTIINVYSEMVFDSLRTDDPNRELLAEIQKAGMRASELTRQLLVFSRRQLLQPQVVNLNTLLSELLRLLKRLIGEDIELTLIPDAALSLAKVDPVHFEQAIINLVVNARDAMPTGGTLTIETCNTDLDREYAEHHPEVQPGPYILVVVSDSGQGMDEVTKARLFEPFFTTKEPGKGTGLGLAMVYGFVKQTGGHIEVFSELGHGTRFHIYLPCAEETIAPTQPSPDLPQNSTGTETVLLVEDEDTVRRLSRLILQSNGYTVLEARDGQEAVLVAQQYQGPIHLLVADLIMPRMSGRQLADLLVPSRAHLRVLFMSGYTDEAVLRQGVRESSVAFLRKPFSPIELARKVREALDAEEVRQ